MEKDGTGTAVEGEGGKAKLKGDIFGKRQGTREDV